MAHARVLPGPLFDIDQAIRLRLDRRREIETYVLEVARESRRLTIEVDALLELRTAEG